MQKIQAISIVVALVCGLGVGTQASLNNASGRLAGPVLTGLLVNFLGGVVTGLAAVIVGQMFVAIIVDTFGLAGGQPIPISWVRVVGLALLALSTWMILPRV